MIEATTEIRVRYAETDQMGVVYHGSYLPWLEQARIHLLDTLGVPYRELEADGFLLPVLEAHLKYKAPARFDDRVAVTARIPDPGNLKIRITYEVRRGENLLAEAWTLHAFINRAGRPVRPPLRLVEALRRSPFEIEFEENRQHGDGASMSIQQKKKRSKN